MTTVAAHFDDDGWPNIFVAYDSTPSILYKNRHDGAFIDIALEAGVASTRMATSRPGWARHRRRLQ
jgi:hypothetical protein